MRQRILAACARLAIHHPKRVLLSTVILTVAGAAALPGLEIDAGHSALMNAESPHIVRAQRFLEEFGATGQLVAVIEGGDETARRCLVDAMEEQLPRSPGAGDATPCSPEAGPGAPGCVSGVVGRVDVDALLSHALLYLSEEQLKEIATALGEESGGLRALASSGSLAGLLTEITQILEERSETMDVADASSAQARAGTRALTGFLKALTARIAGSKDPTSTLREDLLRGVDRDKAGASDLQRGIDDHGYLSSDDGSVKLAMVSSVNESDDPRVVAPFVAYVESQTSHLVGELDAPCADGACPDGPLRVAFTGMPAVIADEARSIRRDLTRTTVIATLGIALLFGVGFRSLRILIIGIGPLLATLIWTLAFARFSFGKLNLLTSSFVATLLGLGIDFAIHFIARFRESRADGRTPAEAVQDALDRTGPAILTGGLTTAGAFFALGVNEFTAFAQLGVMTGVGLIFAMLTSLLVLPALMLCPGLEALQPRPARPRERSGGTGLPEWIAAHPRSLVCAILLITVALGFQGRSIQWSYDYVALLPQDLPSVSAWRSLSEKTEYSVTSAAMTADSYDEAVRMAAALEEKETVLRVEALPAFMPADQEKKRKLLASLRPAVEALTVRNAVSTPATTATAAQELEDALEDARFEARRAGLEAMEDLDALVQASSALHQVLTGVKPERLSALDGELRELRDGALGAIRAAVIDPPLEPEALLAKLPPALASRLFNGEKYALYAHPTEPVDTEAFIERFVAEMRTVDPEVTGYPVTHWETLASVQQGFREASSLAVLVVFLLLLVDFRRLGPTLLALLPLGAGLLWAWGGMALFSMTYNPGNIIGFPLLVGIGVAASVHILHRHQQEGPGRIPEVIRYTGLAVFLSTATTMIGFGSLSLASNQAIASLGVVLLLGVGACLITATVLLPALLAWMEQKRT